MAIGIITLGLGDTNSIILLGFSSQQPSPDVEVDTHDGDDRPFHELGDPYKKQSKKNESVRQSLEKVMAPTVIEPVVQSVQVLTAKPKKDAVGVLGGDYKNMEIALLMEFARQKDEDESISLLLMH